MDWASAASADGGVSSAPVRGGASLSPGAGGLSRTLGAPGGVASEADASRARVLEFLQRHTAYELLPESSKVVVLDTAIPVRQAFHALFEQSVHTAPLWDGGARAFVGMISPGKWRSA